MALYSKHGCHFSDPILLFCLVDPDAHVVLGGPLDLANLYSP